MVLTRDLGHERHHLFSDSEDLLRHCEPVDSIDGHSR